MSESKSLNSTLKAGTAALALALLSACGGGSGGGSTPTPTPTPTPSPTPTPTTPSALDGTITGFGSVFIDGTRYDDSKAKVEFGTDPEIARAGSLAELRAGMRVNAKLNNGLLDTVTVNFALVGTVGAVNASASSFQVFGQTVRVNLAPSDGTLPTVLDGINTLADMKVGDLVRVFGAVATDGSINATRVERRQTDGTEVLRVSGAIQNLDTGAKSFGLLGASNTRVDYSGAKLLPDGATLANNKLVSVIAKASPTVSAGITTVVASKIEVKERKWPDGQGASVGGVISAFQSLASFRIGDMNVDASSAKLVEGTVSADIANGAQALATGAVTSGVMKAETLRVFKKETAIKATVIGQITDYISLSNFTVRGTSVDASQAQFSKGAASDLVTGAWVSLSGSFSGTTLIAKQIEITTPPANKPVSIAGSVSDINSSAKTLKLLGVTVQWNDSTAIVPTGKTVADIAKGSVLRVSGSYDAGTGIFTASRIELLQPVIDGRVVSVEGLISTLDGDILKIGETRIRVSNTTQYEPSGSTQADLKTGVRVQVKAQVSTSGGTVTLNALKIEIQKPGKDDQGRELQYVLGLVSDFVSAASFSVAGQAVDASASSVEWIDGNASKLANGVKLEVKGVMVDGVLKASRVHFEPD